MSSRLRRHGLVILALVVGVAYFAWLTAGAIQDSRERKQARLRIEGLAAKIDATTEAIEAATSPEAQRRNNARIGQIIDDLRLSIDCAELDSEGDYPACADVAGRLDVIRAGGNPFASPPQGD